MRSKLCIPAARRQLSAWPARGLVALVLASAACSALADDDLLVSRSVYSAPANLITVGQALPGGGTAVADASFPNVFSNETPDPSFGITSPIFLDQLSASGTLLGSLNVTSAAASLGFDLSTSYPSKSELGLNLSTDGTAVTFMGYIAPINVLDVSNSNTSGHFDPTNPVGLTYARAVGQLNADGSLQVTPVNAYSGNNGRNAILDSAGNNYLLVGNAGNGSGTEPAAIVSNTGVQLATPGGSPNTTTVGIQQGTPGASNGFQFGFSVAQAGDAADKSGKDDNFRGMTIFNNTLYVTKGSGSNGINTVYQVGATGTLPNASNAATTAINILPGFNTALAKSATNGPNPFGIWFANSTTLYVADEGDGKAADAASSSFAGLQKWTFNGSTWNLAYTLQNGLNLGQNYTVGNYFPTATDGLRNMTGKLNADGSVTIYGVTSTVSGAGDQGADPNKLVSITDQLSFMNGTQATGESFSTVETAAYGQVLRGVSLAPNGLMLSPVPEPSGFQLALAGILLVGIARRRGSKKNTRREAA